MNRKEFIKVCGGSCIGLISLPVFLQGCSPAHYAQGSFQGNKLQVSKNEFVSIKKDKTVYRQYIIVRFEKSDYPIVVYRQTDTDYSALLLRCTHQGNELNVDGDLISCSAHGSEFSKQGKVVQGPAEQNLNTFIVTSDEQNIYIKLV